MKAMDSAVLEALEGRGSAVACADSLLGLADLMGAVVSIERGGSAASLMQGVRDDAFLEDDGRLVVRYTLRPRASYRTSLDYALARVPPGLRASFARVTQSLGGRRQPLDDVADQIAASGRAYEPAGGPDGPGEPGVSGVVRVNLTPALAALHGARDDDNRDNLDAVADSRFLLVDGLGRARPLQGPELEAAARKIRCRVLAYYALLLSRHAALVRSARAAAKMCAEGSEADHGCCAVPSRVFLPG